MTRPVGPPVTTVVWQASQRIAQNNPIAAAGIVTIVGLIAVKTLLDKHPEWVANTRKAANELLSAVAQIEEEEHDIPLDLITGFLSVFKQA